MKVVIERYERAKNYTIGNMYVDGRLFCNTIEDADRGLCQDMSEAQIAAKKVYGETAIPTGKYKVQITYSPKYKRKMPQILNVKGFEGIRIHSGNTAKDSLGCVLLGDKLKAGFVTNSRLRCLDFQQLLTQAGGECELIIK